MVWWSSLKMATSCHAQKWLITALAFTIVVVVVVLVLVVVVFYTVVLHTLHSPYTGIAMRDTVLYVYVSLWDELV